MNFWNFGQAIIMLFRCSTGEDWHKVMYDLSRTGDNCTEGENCGTVFSFLYFISFNIICSLIMLNLFILVIIQQFEEYYIPDDNILDRFNITLL